MCRSPGSVQTTYLFPLVFTYEWELISAYIVSAAKTRDWYYLYLKEHLKNVEAVRLMPFDSVVVCVLRTGPWSSLLDDPPWRPHTAWASRGLSGLLWSTSCCALDRLGGRGSSSDAFFIRAAQHGFPASGAGVAETTWPSRCTLTKACVSPLFSDICTCCSPAMTFYLWTTGCLTRRLTLCPCCI